MGKQEENLKFFDRKGRGGSQIPPGVNQEETAQQEEQPSDGQGTGA